jgi:putative MATE family efflux protein
MSGHPRAGAPLWRSMVAFLAPLLAGNLLQAVSSTIGAIYYGQMIGVSALAVASAFFPLFFFMVSFLIGFANAGAVLVGQAHGAGDRLRVKTVAGTTLSTCLVSGLAIALFCGSFARAILVVIGTPPDILAGALAYGRVMFVLIPVLFVFIAYTTLLRGIGDTRSPFFALLLSTAISAVLIPALIRGWAGLPPLGLMSGPVAGVAAYGAALAWLFRRLRRRGSALAPDGAFLSRLTIDGPILKRLLQLGLPGGTQIVLLSLSEVAVISFVNGFGSGATAAYGAVGQIAEYVQMPAVSVGITAAIFTAQTIGAGSGASLGQVTRTAIGISLATEGCLIAIVYLFHRSVIGWFITTPETADIAAHLLEITLWSYLVFGLTQVLAGTMRGSGTVLWPTTFALSAIWAVEVPVAYLLSRRIGLDGVWIAYPVAFATSLAFQTTYYTTVWRKRRHVRPV